jgi:CheY-like chemotaxis protein
MDEEVRQRAFEPFFTTKSKAEGTGLGLATVYGIVDQSGGQISLETAPGRGTTFRIYLPETKSEQQEVKPPPRQTHEDGGTETLLLVEDNESVRDLSARALRRRGYTVYEAASGEDAINWWMKSGVRPDLLVSDVVMPGISGPQLARQLTESHPSMRVLFISGYTGTEESEGASLAGFPFLQKPFTVGKLAEHVRIVLDTTKK